MQCPQHRLSSHINLIKNEQQRFNPAGSSSGTWRRLNRLFCGHHISFTTILIEPHSKSPSSNRSKLKHSPQTQFPNYNFQGCGTRGSVWFDSPGTLSVSRKRISRPPGRRVMRLPDVPVVMERRLPPGSSSQPPPLRSPQSCCCVDESVTQVKSTLLVQPSITVLHRPAIGHRLIRPGY